MAFADWTYISDGGPALPVWEGVSPIQDTHSYSVNDATNSSTNFAVGLTAGVSANCGRVRILNKQTNPGAPGGIVAWGVFANIQGSFALGSNTYGCTYSASTGLVRIYKTTLSGLHGGGASGSISTDTWGGAAQGEGDVYAIQLNWQQIPATSNLFLAASLDGPIADPDTYDYSTLQLVTSVTDGSAPYLSGVTAGFVGTNNGAAFGGTHRIYYDLVDIFTD